MLLENVGNVLTMIDVMNCITEDPCSLYPHVTLSTSPFWQNCKKRDLLLRWVTLMGYDAGGEVFTLDSHATGVPKELFLEVFCPSAVPVFLFSHLAVGVASADVLPHLQEEFQVLPGAPWPSLTVDAL